LGSVTEEFTGQEAALLWDAYSKEKIDAGIKEVAGIVVSPGKEKLIKGKVKIIHDPKEGAGFEEGDILVATMTSPEYIFLIKKSKAVITDAGGLTSHAAIVSRELNIPCIVGTKIATQVFKDGDMVEVDANKGTVKIIK
jgi:pyruvate,water dikinase